MNFLREGWRWFWLLLPLLAAQCIHSAGAQEAGALQLQIQDPTGSGLKADGRIIGPHTNRTFHTNAAGSVALSGLPFGHYEVRVMSEGFAARAVTVEVNSTSPATMVVALAIAGISSSVSVFSPTPIGPAGESAEQMPVAVQSLSAKNLEDSNALDLTDLMNRRLTSVYVNENQENPYQPDINYRGYTSSPLLGTPQGLSVYLDGVRQNQPFGDIVSWDLIPKVAIRDMALIPGSDPVYGLNTLGGAISVKT
jgi:hypothetical protein